MINKVYFRLCQRPCVLVFLIIFLVGVFLRSYHFSDWLHFELDQSRDAKVINLAIQEGPSNLPLLGPKAAGTFLRLGPTFYYFKYLSALIFGNTPSGIAIIIMLFGMLAIPVFYLFAKRYFSEILSLGLTLLFSVSIFLVVYSRFSWNPNPLVLFVILTFLSLLKAVDSEEKNRNLWFLLFAFALAVSTQLHFLAFVAVPAISFVFLILKRPKINIKYWAGALAIVVFLYFPAITNDIKTGGDNIGQFLKVSEKKSGKSDRNILEKAIKNYEENSLGYFVLISGQQTGELPRFAIGSEGANLICDKDCKAGLPLGILATIIFTLGAVLLFKNVYFEKDQRKKDFLMLNAAWFFVVFGLYTMIAFDISPRFWLLISALPFVFLGLVLDFLGKNFGHRMSKWIMIAAVLILAFSNLYEIKKRFWQLENAPRESFKIPADKILKERNRVTLKQQYMIANYIKSAYDQNKYPVYLNSDPQYRRSLLFHIDQLEIPRDDFRNATNSGKVYEKGNYFLIYPTESSISSDIEKYTASYDAKDKKQFGTLTLIEMTPKKEAINAVEQDFSPEKESKSSPGVPIRYKWEQIFNESTGDESDN